MIDTERWVLVETWLSLGLRIRWARPFQATDMDRRGERELIQRDEDTGLSFWYEGDGEWLVIRPEDGRRSSFPFPLNDAPTMSAAAMRHELAHYLRATAEARDKRNFGLTESDQDEESATLSVEAVIAALTQSCGHVVSAAMGPRKP